MLASHWMLTCFFPLRPLNNKNKSLKRKWKLKQKFFVRLRWNLKTRYSLYFSNNFTLLSVAVAIKLSMRASSPAWRAQITATCTNEAKSIATRKKKKTRSILSHVVTSLILNNASSLVLWLCFFPQKVKLVAFEEHFAEKVSRWLFFLHRPEHICFQVTNLS